MPRRYNLDKSYFDVIDTPDKAYWLGYLGADGNVYGGELSLKCHTQDMDILEKFKGCVKSTHPIIEGVNNLGSPYATLKIKSRPLVTALAIHGIHSNKTWTLTPPKLPSFLMGHYWRGAIDGDGWISTGQNGTTKRFYTIGLCGNKQIVTGFRDFVADLTGQRNKLVKTGPADKPFYQVAYTGTFIAPEILRLLDYTNSLSLNRKQALAHEILSYAPPQKRPTSITFDTARSVLSDYATGDYSHDQLAQKYNVGRGTIYNITNRRGRFATLTE